MKVSAAVKDMLGVIRFDIKEDKPICGAFLDSRLVTNNSLFFAVKGDLNDGNAYAQKALEKGAAAVVMTDEEMYEKIIGNKILVSDCVETIKDFGTKRLQSVKAVKFAVTGSFGKTGAKEMLKDILSVHSCVYATVGNKNNELGLTLTGAGIDDRAKFVVLEMGSNAMGEIETLSKIAQPDVAIVVSVGLAHVGRFGSLENIIKEKLSIVAGLKKGGTLIVPEYVKNNVPNGDFKVVTFGKEQESDYYITELHHEGLTTVFRINNDDTLYKIPHIYEHLAYNSLGVIAAASSQNIPKACIVEGLSRFKLLNGHGSIEKASGLVIINDTYNAGFDSVIKCIESLDKTSFPNKYAILGELGEIEGYEEKIYSDIGKLASKFPKIQFYLCGKSYKKLKPLANRRIIDTKADCMEALDGLDKGIVFVKASNFYKFGEVVDFLKTSREAKRNAL